MSLSIKLGADPEGFLFVGPNPISADGLFPGDKKTPFKVERGAVQVDGMAVEFNIDADETEDEFERNMSTVLAQLNEMALKIDRDAHIVWTPIVEFSEGVWNGSSNESKVLGCDPDWNYAGEINPNPSDKLEGQRFRTAAGHIHIGWTSGRSGSEPDHFYDCHYIAKYFHDQSTQGKLNLFAPQEPAEFRRLEFYGMNASFRPKSYGVELRGPSNRWVRTEQSRREMYRQVRSTMTAATGF
jgi:hypothetical protein